MEPVTGDKDVFGDGSVVMLDMPGHTPGHHALLMKLAHKGYVLLSGDTAPCPALAVAAHQADVLVHEATFVEEELERARETSHSTARQAAELARDAEVHLLALTHVSSRYSGGEIRDEARAAFAATEVPRDFDTIEVPFPERGAPTLVRWSERKALQAGDAAAAAAGADGELSPAEPVASP